MRGRQPGVTISGLTVLLTALVIAARAAEVGVYDSTEFVQGVAAFCADGGQTTLKISRSVPACVCVHPARIWSCVPDCPLRRLHRNIVVNTSFPDGGGLDCVQPGVLTLDGSSVPGNAILDAQMRSNLTLPWNSDTPTLVWQVSAALHAPGSRCPSRGAASCACALLCFA